MFACLLVIAVAVVSCGCCWLDVVGFCLWLSGVGGVCRWWCLLLLMRLLFVAAVSVGC